MLNDDRIAPGSGFSEHGHRDMEIISIVLDGALEHRDSAGNHEVLRRGDVQVMSAGSGIRHSEKNFSSDEPAHFIQIWIEPDQTGHSPGHARIPAPESATHRWREIASGHPRGDGLRINQDASIAIADLCKDDTIQVEVEKDRIGYLHVATGAIEIGQEGLNAGDAVELGAATSLAIRSGDSSTLLLFDLPAT